LLQRWAVECWDGKINGGRFAAGEPRSSAAALLFLFWAASGLKVDALLPGPHRQQMSTRTTESEDPCEGKMSPLVEPHSNTPSPFPRRVDVLAGVMNR
jgi:hypothetical protein